MPKYRRLRDFERPKVDMNDLYTVEHKFKKNAGKDTSLTVQFHRSDPGNKKGFNSKNSSFIKFLELAFKNRDQFYLILNGMDKIEWGSKDPVKCIERMFVGNGPPPQKRYAHHPIATITDF